MTLTGEPMPARQDTVRHIRAILERTQAELAAALGISEKAVQSYEQGWRKTPVRVMMQLLVLLAIHRRMDDVPCWDIVDCPHPRRDACPSHSIGKGRFCWFIAPEHCHPPTVDTDKDVLPCMSCPVIQRLLSGDEAAGEVKVQRGH